MPRSSTRAGGPCRPRTICSAFRANGGTMIGVGNGNPNSLEPDVASQRKAFNGLAQAIVRVEEGQARSIASRRERRLVRRTAMQDSRSGRK